MQVHYKVCQWGLIQTWVCNLKKTVTGRICIIICYSDKSNKFQEVNTFASHCIFLEHHIATKSETLVTINGGTVWYNMIFFNLLYFFIFKRECNVVNGIIRIEK